MISLADLGSNSMLDALAAVMDGGALEILSDNNQQVLAILRLASPAAMPAVDGTLELNPIAEEDAAPNSGNAAFARILTRSGAEVFVCDVGARGSGAVIELNTTRITEGGPLKISSFKLSMP